MQEFRASLTPRINPLTQKLDKLNSTSFAMQGYDHRMLTPHSLQVVPRPPAVHNAEQLTPRSTMSTTSPRSHIPVY